MAGGNQDKTNQRNKTSKVLLFAKWGLILCSPFLWIAYGLRKASDKNMFHVPGFKARASIKNPDGRGITAAWVLSAIFWGFGATFLVNPIVAIFVGAVIGGIVTFVDKMEPKNKYQKMKSEDSSADGVDDTSDHQKPFESNVPVKPQQPAQGKLAESCGQEALRHRPNAGAGVAAPTMVR